MASSKSLTDKGLRLEVGPNEHFMVNGVLFKNSGMRAKFICTDSAYPSILKGKMVMLESEATTELRKMYLFLQKCYMTQNDVERARLVDQLSQSYFQALRAAMTGQEFIRFAQLVIDKEFYQALKLLLQLIKTQESSGPEPSA